MTCSTHTRKLAELRAKTDRQLVAYVSAQLDRALAWAEAGEYLNSAERIYSEVRQLLPVVRAAASHEQWRRLTVQAGELREMLDGYSVHCVA